MKKASAFLSLLLSIIIVFSICPVVYADDDEAVEQTTIEYDASGIDGFIARLYDLVMGRKYDQSGLNYWKDQLYSGSMNASNIARFFFSCDEYYSLNYSLDNYLKVLYRVFFDREPDDGGFTYWKNCVYYNGFTRKDVLEGFIASQEWANVCAKYGVVSGTGVNPTITISRSAATETFVKSLYKDVLGRDGDTSGINFWCDNLTYKRDSAKSVAYGFFHSPEFSNIYNSKSNEDKVKIFYKVFLQREPDASGLKYWVDQISGKNGLEILYNGFIDSEEFANKCKQNGILVNMPDPTPRYNKIQIEKEYYPVVTSSGTEYVYGYFDKTMAQEIVDATNSYRSSKGLSALKSDAELQNCANIRAYEQYKSMGHTRPNGSKFNSVISSVGVKAENVGCGTIGCTSSMFMDMWKNSTNHSKNMSNNYTYISVAVFIADTPNSNGHRVFVVQQFK